jgi:hypothetical protein
MELYQMITVSVSGFSNKEQAQVFVDWYEGQGEQDAGYWFEEWCPELNPCSLKCDVKHRQPTSAKEGIK